MTRLVRLNEVQYTETEHQVAALVAQGFHEEALPAAPVVENPPEPAPNPAPEPEPLPAPEPEPLPAPEPKPSGKKGGKG